MAKEWRGSEMSRVSRSDRYRWEGNAADFDGCDGKSTGHAIGAPLL